MNEKTLHPTIDKIRNERTFVMVKPDGVKRGLTGEILTRLNNAGLKVVAMKMINATEKQITDHYPMQDQEWLEGLGQKGLDTFANLNLDPIEFLGSADKAEIGKGVAKSLIGYMQSGPVVCMVVQGIGSIDAVRKMVGHTLPFKADPGTIRADFSVDSPTVANVQGRAIHNVIHASVVPVEADAEIAVWFTPEEILNYNLASEDILYSKTY
jgi:nucleoside-diphosphate kinase